MFFFCDKEELLKYLANKNDCSVEDIKIEVREYEEETHILVNCECCQKAEVYEFESKEQREELAEYCLYGNPKHKLIQDIVPNMKPWMREAFMRVSMGFFCEECYKDRCKSYELDTDDFEYSDSMDIEVDNCEEQDR